MFICIIPVAVIFTLIETNIIPVFKRGFFCDDRTIIYKFNGETVSIVTLLVVTLPAQFFVVSELISCFAIKLPAYESQ